jgi:hypothetical protein
MFSVVDGWKGIPRPTIHVNEQSKRHPRGTFVAVEEWVVLGEAHEQYRRLVDEVWEEAFWPKPADGACRAESAKSNLVAVISVRTSSPVTAAATAR